MVGEEEGGQHGPTDVQLTLCVSLACRSEVYDEWGKPKTANSKHNVCVCLCSTAPSVTAVLSSSLRPLQ